MAQHVIRPIPLVLGASKLSDHTYRVDFGRNTVTCTYIWYIEGPEKKILVDAGSDAATFEKYGYPGRIDVQSPEDGLAKLGLKPADIDIVIITHLHFDHWLFANKYTNATFVVQKSEIDYHMNPLPFETRQPMASNALDHLKLQVVDGDVEIADGVSVMLTPGHTGGGQSVVISTAKGKAVIDGLCGVPETFNPPKGLKREVPVIPSMIHIDLQQSYDSLLRIKETADIIIPLHDVKASYADKLP